MPKKATKAANSVFYLTRMEAAKWNDKLNSREGAAELTGLDRTRIAYIELGTVAPYPEEILILSDTYNAPELMNHYCSHLCPLGKQTVEPVEIKELEAATLQLVAAIKDIPRVTDDLIEITEDGIIDDTEKAMMEQVLNTLKKTAQRINALEIIYKKRLRTLDGDVDG